MYTNNYLKNICNGFFSVVLKSTSTCAYWLPNMCMRGIERAVYIESLYNICIDILPILVKDCFSSCDYIY